MAAGYACTSGAAFAVTSGAKTLINLISGATAANATKPTNGTASKLSTSRNLLFALS